MYSTLEPERNATQPDSPGTVGFAPELSTLAPAASSAPVLPTKSVFLPSLSPVTRAPAFISMCHTKPVQFRPTCPGLTSRPL